MSNALQQRLANARAKRARLAKKRQAQFLQPTTRETELTDMDFFAAEEELGAALVAIDNAEFEEAKRNGWLNRILGK